MERIKRLIARLDGMKLAVLAVFAGLCLLLIPSQAQTDGAQTLSEREQLQQLLSHIAGAGETELMLSDSGAVVVCEGADNASVSLKLCQALQCYTGFGASRIRIFLMQSN